MNTRPMRTLCALACAMTASPALAADPAGESHWYATALAGANFMSDQSLSFSGASLAGSTEASFDTGLAIGVVVGHAFNRNWRAEAEFVYQLLEHDGVELAGSSLPSGNYGSFSLAVNGLYSFDAFGSDALRPYVGAGLAWLTEVGIDFEQGRNELFYSGDGFGVQLLGGARYDLGERFFVDAGLRYLVGGEVTMVGDGRTPGRVKADYEPWGVTLGVGFKF
jgi:opacity protein-like surface antigen